MTNKSCNNIMYILGCDSRFGEFIKEMDKDLKFFLEYSNEENGYFIEFLTERSCPHNTLTAITDRFPHLLLDIYVLSYFLECGYISYNAFKNGKWINLITINNNQHERI